MDITNELVEHIAYLAKLEFEGGKKEAIKADLTKIIDFIDQLNEVDTEDVEPLIFMTDSINVLREDIQKDTLTQKQGLKNAPNHDSDYFKIAKVLKK